MPAAVITSTSQLFADTARLSNKTPTATYNEIHDTSNGYN